MVQMKNVSQRIGNLPAIGESGCNIQIVSAGKQIVEDQVVDALRLRIEADARIQICGAGFDDHDERVGIWAWRRKTDSGSKHDRQRPRREPSTWKIVGGLRSEIAAESWDRKSFPGSQAASRRLRKVYWKGAGAMSHRRARRMRPLLSHPTASRTSSDVRSWTPREASCTVSMCISVAFLTPPPDTIISHLPRFEPPAGLITKSRIASAIDRAVNAVAVAITSSFRELPQLCKKSLTNSRPNSSRPAVFGGLPRKKFCRRTAKNNRFHHLAGCRDLSAAIERFAKQLFSERINHHIPGPGVECHYAIGRGIRGNRSKICDAANILHDACPRVSHETKDSREREPGVRLFRRQPCRRDENRRPPERPRARQ